VSHFLLLTSFEPQNSLKTPKKQSKPPIVQHPPQSLLS
jgi:hypothetical protein